MSSDDLDENIIDNQQVNDITNRLITYCIEVDGFEFQDIHIIDKDNLNQDIYSILNTDDGINVYESTTMPNGNIIIKISSNNSFIYFLQQPNRKPVIHSCFKDSLTGYTLPAVISADGTQYWYNNMMIHRDDIIEINGHKQYMPAVIYTNGDRKWYWKNNIHRNDTVLIDGFPQTLPAIIEINGTQKWYKHGKIHRTDKIIKEKYIDNKKIKYLSDHTMPAVIRPSGSSFWYFEGKYHRNDKDKNGNTLPAVIHNYGDLQWYLYGKLHRDDMNRKHELLPAIITNDGYEEYYINGVEDNVESEQPKLNFTRNTDVDNKIMDVEEFLYGNGDDNTSINNTSINNKPSLTDSSLTDENYLVNDKISLFDENYMNTVNKYFEPNRKIPFTNINENGEYEIFNDVSNIENQQINQHKNLLNLENIDDEELKIAIAMSNADDANRLLKELSDDKTDDENDIMNNIVENHIDITIPDDVKALMTPDELVYNLHYKNTDSNFIDVELLEQKFNDNNNRNIFTGNNMYHL